MEQRLIEKLRNNREEQDIYIWEEASFDQNSAAWQVRIDCDTDT